MQSKEEIEKAKKVLYPLKIGDFITWFTADGVIKVELAIETLLEYIEQLETREQKLIEILEKYEHAEANEDNARRLYMEFRKILKGENDE